MLWLIDLDSLKSESLIRLAPCLTSPVLLEALDIARSIDDERSKSEALAALTPPLIREGYPREILSAACSIVDDEQRAAVLSVLAPHLAELRPVSLQNSLMSEALDMLGSRSRRAFQIDLQALLPVIVDMGGAESLAEDLPSPSRRSALVAVTTYM